MSDRLEQLSNTLTKDNRILQLRRTSKINKEELFNTIFPQKISMHFNEVYKIIRDNSHIFQHSDIEQLSRAEQRKYGTMQALTILKNMKINLQEDQYRFVAAVYALSFFGVGTSIKTFVHYLLFIKTLLIFRTNNYHKHYIEDTHKFLFNYIGSFGLTELHHGSFSRGVATEAIYDHKTKEFIITSNGEAGMKFWIGAMASTACMTIMWAQLIVNGENYGPHPFLMKIRDPQTHQVLPGIIIGDCGPKNGLDTIDNGYMMVNNVRIPKESLLGKLGEVDQNGKYQSKIKTNEQRFGLHMSPLSSGRANLALITLTQSAAALTIAIRYACLRRQFKIDSKSQQTLIIDYPTTRYRLIVPLASTMVYYFGGVLTAGLYIENSNNFTDPNKRIVAELHAASAVLKARASWFTNATITECREVLGGHGYSAFSRLGKYYHDNDVNSTWEGDNNLLLQQTSKYVLKAIRTKERGSILNLQFVHDGPQKLDWTQQSLNSLTSLKLLIQHLFISKYHATVKEMSKIKNSLESGKEKINKQLFEAEIWNRLQPYFANQMALAYGDLIYFDTMYKAILDSKGSEQNKRFLETCLKIWSQSLLLKSSVEDISCRKMLQNLILKGCEQIYPDCVAVTDVLVPPNYVIGSPFSQQDGEGMKEYINLVFSGKNAFGRVPWFDRIIKLKEQQSSK